MATSQPQSVARTAFLALFYSFALTAGGIVAFSEIFSVFREYDDEGYVMMSVQSFFDGHALYDDVYTQYGPCFFFYKAIVHFFTGGTVTHDVTRLTTIVVWLATTLLCSLLAYRMTRSGWLASAVFLLTFLILRAEINEPGHPQELCALLLAASVYLASFGSSMKRLRFILMGWGVLAAMVLLTKINVGLYLCLALAGTTVAFFPTGRIRQLTVWLLLGVAFALPFVLMHDHLSIAWAQNYAVVAALSCSSAVAVAAFAVRVRDLRISFRSTAATAGTFLAAGLLILAITLSCGTSMAGFWHGVVGQHLHFANIFSIPADISMFSGISALGASFMAGMVCLHQRKLIRLPVQLDRSMPILIGIARLLFAIGVTTACIMGNAVALMAFATPWIWLAVVRPSSSDSTPNDWLGRTTLTLVAAFQMLQAYPVAGSQLSFSTFLIIPVAAVCFHDVWRELEAVKLRWIVPFAHVGKFAAYASIVLTWCWLAYDYQTDYQQKTPLNLPGAYWIRVGNTQAAVLRGVAKILHRENDGFITLPGMNSFYFWSEHEPFTAANATLWMTLLDDNQQRAIIDELERHPNACLIRNQNLVQFWLQGENLPDKPLVRYLSEHFMPVAAFGSYQFLIRSIHSLPAATVSLSTDPSSKQKTR